MISTAPSRVSSATITWALGSCKPLEGMGCPNPSLFPQPPAQCPPVDKHQTQQTNTRRGMSWLSPGAACPQLRSDGTGAYRLESAWNCTRSLKMCNTIQKPTGYRGTAETERKKTEKRKSCPEQTLFIRISPYPVVK